MVCVDVRPSMFLSGYDERDYRLCVLMYPFLECKHYIKERENSILVATPNAMRNSVLVCTSTRRDSKAIMT
jgi:hypothetical protein